MQQAQNTINVIHKEHANLIHILSSSRSALIIIPAYLGLKNNRKPNIHEILNMRKYKAAHQRHTHPSNLTSYNTLKIKYGPKPKTQ